MKITYVLLQTSAISQVEGQRDPPDVFLINFLQGNEKYDINKTIKKIKDSGISVGLALNPETPLEIAQPFLGQIDILLIMTVVPGFGGQQFMNDATMPKVKEAIKIREENDLNFHIQVDGGITASTAKIAAEHGANIMVAGTNTFRSTDMKLAIKELRDA